MKRPVRSDIKRPNVLVASPDGYFRLMVSEILSMSGYGGIEQAPTTRGLLELIGRRTFNVLILDEAMSDLTSAEVARMVRNGSADDQLPKIVAVVSQATRSVVDDARNVGIDAVITKPVVPLRLTRTLGYLWQMASAA
jgi:CheY-like chemotaxis protein